MHFIPSTQDEEKLILKRMNISKFSELVDIIPKNIRLKERINILFCTIIMQLYKLSLTKYYKN